MSVDDRGRPGSDFEISDVPVPPPPAGDPAPLGTLARLTSRQARLGSVLARAASGERAGSALAWLRGALGVGVEVGQPEIVWRASGLSRAGLVARLNWPSFSSRLAVGVETPVAHAIVDRLLGFDRLPPEERLPLSPVEWGILTYVAGETLRRLAAAPGGPIGADDLTIERVGPDSFEAGGLGRVVTIRWPVSLGAAAGSIRLWLPESLAARRLTDGGPPGPTAPAVDARRFAELDGVWRAEAGAVTLPRGLKTVRPGAVLPLTGSPIRGAPVSPTGAVDLAMSVAEPGGRFWMPAEPVPLSGGGRLTLTDSMRYEPKPREPIAVNPTPAPTHPEPGADVPVTLVVELGRVNLTVRRLADLRPGDVVELGRHAREPVELTSGGKLVARGELVQIDTELGVRVTRVFL